MGFFSRLRSGKNSKKTSPADLEAVSSTDMPNLISSSEEPDDEGTIGYSEPERNFRSDYAQTEAKPYIGIKEDVEDKDYDEFTIGLNKAYQAGSGSGEACGSLDCDDDAIGSELRDYFLNDDEKTIALCSRLAMDDDDEKTIGLDGRGYSEDYSDEETVVPYFAGSDADYGEETINPYAGSWKRTRHICFTIDGARGVAEKEVAFCDEMEIGRDPECGLNLTEPFVSRHHIRLTANNGAVMAVNLSTKKTADYTAVNDAPLGTLEREIKPGDVIQILNIRIRISSLR